MNVLNTINAQIETLQEASNDLSNMVNTLSDLKLDTVYLVIRGNTPISAHVNKHVANAAKSTAVQEELASGGGKLVTVLPLPLEIT